MVRTVMWAGGLGTALLAAGMGAALLWQGTITAQNQNVPEPAPFSSAAPVTSAPPVRTDQVKAQQLVIPDLGINAPFSSGGLVDGNLQLPSDPSRLTVWSKGGQPCGTSGTVLVAGHVINQETRGALWNLHKVQAGTVCLPRLR